MKKIVYISLFLLAITFQGCDDQEEVLTPDFKVQIENETVKVGEEVTFKVENAPNFLYFYAGDFGHQYKYKDRTNAEGTVTMSFKNAQKWGLGTNATNTLSVLASSNYDGAGTVESIANATWTDISDRFNISEDYTFDWTESGNVNITDLADGEPIYFAFRFYAEDHKGNGNRQPEWRIDDFNIEMAVDGAPAPLTVATMESPGWQTVDVQGVVSSWNTAKWYYTNGYWRFRGSPSNYANEDWLVTKSINLTKVAPDQGVPLKTYSDKLESFTYTYSKPGTYTVTLIGNNTTIYGDEEKITEFTIEVTE